MCIRLDKTITSRTDGQKWYKNYRALHASGCWRVIKIISFSYCRQFNHMTNCILFWNTLHRRVRTTSVVIVVVLVFHRQRRRRLFFISWFQRQLLHTRRFFVTSRLHIFAQCRYMTRVVGCVHQTGRQQSEDNHADYFSQHLAVNLPTHTTPSVVQHPNFTAQMSTCGTQYSTRVNSKTRCKTVRNWNGTSMKKKL